MSKELKTKTDKELNKILAEAREDIRKTRFNLSGAATKNVKAMKEQRKNVARILTEKNSR